jgi:hypothetical protein
VACTSPGAPAPPARPVLGACFFLGSGRPPAAALTPPPDPGVVSRSQGTLYPAPKTEPRYRHKSSSSFMSGDLQDSAGATSRQRRNQWGAPATYKKNRGLRDHAPFKKKVFLKRGKKMEVNAGVPELLSGRISVTPLALITPLDPLMPLTPQNSLISLVWELSPTS